MLPLINGKLLENCDYKDIMEIINMPEFRESEWIDYKGDFEVLKHSKDDRTKRNKALDEFCIDVCAFANSYGGYLVYGIKETDGIPVELSGVTVEENKIDRLLMNIQNWLQRIQPKAPNVVPHIISCDTGKQIMILRIYRDSFAPYGLFVENREFRFFSRVGNQKMPMTYSGLKSMFISSLNLEKEINRFRTERIEHNSILLQSSRCADMRFLLLHIIPETFLDSSYNQPLYVICRQKKVSFASIVGQLLYSDVEFPMAEGIRFTSSKTNGSEGRIFNNGTLECCSLMDNFLHKASATETTMAWVALLDKIEMVVRDYFSKVAVLFATNRFFVGISILGCEGVVTEKAEASLCASSIIDRDKLLVPPAVVETSSDDSIDTGINRMLLDCMLAFGVTKHSRCKGLLNELYNVGTSDRM